MRVLVIEPGCRPQVREMDDALEVMQEMVGGLIQVLYPFEEPVALIYNDEGKLMNLPMNRALRDDDGRPYDILCGTFLICGIEEDHFTSLTEELEEKFIRFFGTPEIFLGMDGHLIVLPLSVEE